MKIFLLYILFFASRSKCLSKMEELKEQCEEKLKASPEDSKIQQEKKKELTTNISEKKQVRL